MEDYRYEYKNPTEYGFTQFTLTKKQHNELFPNRKVKWHKRYEYYYDDFRIILHGFASWKSIVLATILFPVSVIYYGLGNFKETVTELKRLYNQKKYGAFVGDYVNANTDIYDKVMELIS